MIFRKIDLPTNSNTSVLYPSTTQNTPSINFNKRIPFIPIPRIHHNKEKNHITCDSHNIVCEKGFSRL